MMNNKWYNFLFLMYEYVSFCCVELMYKILIFLLVLCVINSVILYIVGELFKKFFLRVIFVK